MKGLQWPLWLPFSALEVLNDNRTL